MKSGRIHLMKSEVLTKQSGHFHIVVQKTVRGDSPVIRGTRISVANIASYYLLGMNAEDIHRELPHLTLSQIFDALAYYFDHKAIIDRAIEANSEKAVSLQFPAVKN